jgi:hypothetical protein
LTSQLLEERNKKKKKKKKTRKGTIVSGEIFKPGLSLTCAFFFPVVDNHLVGPTPLVIEWSSV